MIQFASYRVLHSKSGIDSFFSYLKLKKIVLFFGISNSFFYGLSFIAYWYRASETTFLKTKMLEAKNIILKLEKWRYI